VFKIGVFNVEPRIKRRRNKDRTFGITLAEIRVKVAVINAVLIFCALGLHNTKINYSIAGAYLAINFFCQFLPPLRKLATRSLRFFLLSIDVMVVGFMIAETGGAASDLYPFLFIPILLAVLRYKYPGIILWCTSMSMLLLGASFYSGTLQWMMWMPLVLKVGYLYLAGIIGGYLIKQTFSVKEEVSKTLTRWNIDLQRLNSFSQEINASSDMEQIFSQITKTIRQTNTAQMVAMMLFDDESLKIYDSLGWEENWVERYHCNPLSKHSLALAPIIVFKEPLLCSDIRRHPELVRTFKEIPIESLFAFPLVITGEVVGALVITNPVSHILNDQETQILTSITSQASMAIQNILNLNQEKRKADTDGLTGLYNRRYFNEQIEWQFDRALNQGLPLSLILMDVDNFKKYNDTYGHPAGDQLLKVMTSAISEVVREQDIFARYGGEEFAVILRDTNNKLAMHIAERIRQVVAGIPVSAGTLKCPISVSIGAGTFPDHAGDRISLLEFVDKSLYHAKNNGKNRVCCGDK
jgi:diguanylate cyclase (GGDEF)-like protein